MLKAVPLHISNAKYLLIYSHKLKRMVKRINIVKVKDEKADPK